MAQIPDSAPANHGEMVTLREFIQHLMEERDRRYEERFKAQGEAVRVALDSQAVRFAGTNEWRQTVDALIANCATKGEIIALQGDFNGRLGALADKLDSLEKRSRSEVEQRTAAISEKVDGLDKRMDRAEGAGHGKREGWGYLVGGIGLIATLLAIFAWFATRIPGVIKP